jgi:predicted mannosyl-3-phosphoglycerate phosphatase (HAD superfamily)
MFFTADAEDVTLMNSSYTFKPAQTNTNQVHKTDTELLINTAKTFKNLNFTWRQQMFIRICFCCKMKDKHSKMFEKGKK